MAVDTAVKRQSAVATRKLPWLRRFYPFPSGAVDQPDRQHAGFVYRGIAAGEPADDYPAEVCVTGAYVNELAVTGQYVSQLDVTGIYPEC